jgi:carboxylate-amine ligase
VTMEHPSFTLGIEEEYLLVDKQSRDLVKDPPPSLMEEAARVCGEQVSPEYLQAQIEVGTRVCRTVSEAREDLACLRRGIIQVADQHGLAPIAASTHPFAHWLEQKHTDKERYQTLAQELQAAARRMLICGMHVHVGIEDNALRIDLMNQIMYFLPHLLALSSSSPFWRGEETGLKSFRMTVFDSLPRTRLPERFYSFGEYQRHVDVLIKAGIIEDTSKIWWDIRPSSRFPTLETRIMDVCTRVEDAVCLAALVVCLMRMLYRLRLKNQRWRNYASMLIYENRWRAVRYGYDEGMLDLARGEVRRFAELQDELLEMIREDAEELGCVAEVEHSREILARGTSAHRQVQVYRKAMEQGADKEQALIAVVDALIEDTARDV